MLPNLRQLDISENPFFVDDYFPSILGQEGQIDLTTAHNIKRFIIKRNTELVLFNNKEFNRRKMESTIIEVEEEALDEEVKEEEAQGTQEEGEQIEENEQADNLQQFQTVKPEEQKETPVQQTTAGQQETKKQDDDDEDSDEPMFAAKNKGPNQPPPQMNMPASNEPPPKVRRRKVIAPPNLDQLLYSVECANGNHRYAGDHVEDLGNDVDILIEKLEMIDEHFAKNQSDDVIFEKMESFIQNTQLLIDNHAELIEILLEILAKLTIIKFHDFGLMCFDMLGNLMIAGRELEEAVIEVVQSNIIKNLRQPNPEDIPVNLLLGLHSMILETEQTDLLTPMFELSFPVWLKEYCRILDDCARLKQPMQDHAHYDSIICLLSLSVKGNPHNVNLVLEKQLYVQIIRILKQTTPKDMRYIQVLELMAACANEEEDLADIFILDNVHKPLLKSIKKDMETFKNLGTLFTDESRETIPEQMKKYQTMAAEIKTLGGMLVSEHVHKKNEILDEPVIKDLISIIGTEKATDPILLTAICTFGKDLLETQEICFDRERMEPFAEKMKDLMFVVPYLGFKKYAKLLYLTRRYRDAEQTEQKVTDSGAFKEEGETHHMPSQLESTVDLVAAKEKNQEQIISSLEQLDDPLASQLFVSIIELIKFICLQGQYNDQNSLFDEMSETLNNLEDVSGEEGMSRENALFQCLKVPDDSVKVVTVECLFTINIDELDTNEISQIVNAVLQCPDISVGDTEIVLSTIFWIQTKFVQGDIEKADSVKIFQMMFGNQCIQEGLRILCNNLKRESHSENEEDEQKYILSLSILNFIKSSSVMPLMQKYFGDKSELFKQILIYEDLNSSQRIGRVPIDIENSLIGRNMSTLIETIIGVQTLQPYCDVSLRVIMKMADCLMHRHDCKFYMIDEQKDTKEELLKFQAKIYRKKKSDERRYWLDPHPRFIDNLDEEQKIELHTQHYNFTQSNGIALLRMFLMPKFPQNEKFTKDLIDDCFDETKQFDAEGRPTGLGPDIYEETGILDQKFSNKYVGKDEKQLRRVYLRRKQKKEGGNQVEEEAVEKERDIKDAATNALFQENAVRSNKYEFKQSQQFNEVGIECLEARLVGNSGDLKEEKYQFLRDRDLEERHRREDPEEGAILIPKDRRFDGFLNKDLRSLTIAAYLRCLYASIEYAPSVALKKSAIQNVSDPLVFRGITQLCDSTDWDEEANLGAKYLRIVRHVLKLDYTQVSDRSENLNVYEIVSTVISKALSKIVNKMKNDVLLTNYDVITSYEISLTFFTIVSQSNNFVFSTSDLYALHLTNEEKIMKQAALDKDNKGKKRVMYKLSKEDEFNLLKEENLSEAERIKCSNIPSKGHSVDDFKISLPILRNKRTIQEKIVEFMILKIFQKQSIFSLIEILFKDMNEDYKDFEPDLEEDDIKEEQKVDAMSEMMMVEDMDDDEEMSGDEQEDEEENINTGEQTKKGEEDEEEADDDAFNLGIDIDEYMGVKGVLNIERIKDIVGEIMNSCQDLKYEILENIMKGVVFQEMKLRESFMQEILNAAQSASYRNALEQFIFHNQLSVNKYFTFEKRTGQFDREIFRERIIEYSNVDLNNKVKGWLECDIIDPVLKNGYVTPNENYYQRLLILVTQGIIVMKNLAKKDQCQNCPLSKFCPYGPKQVFCLKYEDIETVVKFPQFPQKLAIIYTLHSYDEKEGHKNGTLRFQMNVEIPTFTKCAKLYGQLMSILKLVNDDRALRKEKDQLTDKEKLRPKDYDISYSDLLSQWELRMVLTLAMDTEVKKKDSNYSQFISAQMQSCSVISDEFFNEVVKDSIDPYFGIEPILQGGDPKKINKKRVLGDEDVQQIQDSVFIGIIGKYFIILKDSWENWFFIENQADLKKYKKEWIEEYDLEKCKEKYAIEMEEEIPNLEDIGHHEDQDREETVRQMDLYCRPRCSNLFQLVSIIKIDDIQNLFIHKGKDPSIEIRCFGEQKHTIRLMFTGDMERQTFLSSMLDCWKSKDEESEDSEQAESDTDSDDVKNLSDSDEDVVDGQIYD